MWNIYIHIEHQSMPHSLCWRLKCDAEESSTTAEPGIKGYCVPPRVAEGKDVRENEAMAPRQDHLSAAVQSKTRGKKEVSRVPADTWQFKTRICLRCHSIPKGNRMGCQEGMSLYDVVKEYCRSMWIFPVRKFDEEIEKLTGYGLNSYIWMYLLCCEVTEIQTL